MPAAARSRAKSRSRSSSRTAASRKAAAARAKRAHAARVRRRRLVGGGIFLALVGVVVAIIAFGLFDKQIREVTLPLRHDDIIRQQAADKGVDAELIAAVINVESGFTDATSHAGARGLMQVTPETANEVEQLSGGTTFDPATDLSDPQINIQYGTFYLRHLLEIYGGNEVAALAAYNAGQGNVAEWGGAELEQDDIQFAETRTYVADVLQKRDEYRDNYGRELGLD